MKNDVLSRRPWSSDVVRFSLCLLCYNSNGLIIIMAVKLLNIDCMEYMKTLPDKAFDLAIVDTPYGRGEDGGVNRSHNVIQKGGSVLHCSSPIHAKKSWDKEPPSKEYFDELMRVSTHQIIFGANYMPVNLRGGMIIWDKLNDGSDQSDAEIAYCSLTDKVEMARYMWRGMMQGDSVGSFKQQGNKKLNEKIIHPTQKPVKLYEWLLMKYANPSMRILDTHLGSGSSAIAAHYFGCDFVGCEIDQGYYQAAVARFERETAQLAMFG